jgi:hypothetical protein
MPREGRPDTACAPPRREPSRAVQREVPRASNQRRARATYPEALAPREEVRGQSTNPPARESPRDIAHEKGSAECRDEAKKASRRAPPIYLKMHNHSPRAVVSRGPNAC